MSWKYYKRTGGIMARPYVPGEDLSGVSVSAADKARPSLDGGMIARNPANLDDEWYIAPEFFESHYVTAQSEEVSP